MLISSTTLLLSLSFIHFGEALSCLPCEEVECEETPSCCKSGFYTKDVCGCCNVCAKAENEECGGPWNIAGMCGSGTRCVRQCECKTIKSGKDCIFPFKYKGTTYNKCTKAGSENGQPWCATRVDADGTVVRNFWEDCEEGCPGTSFECSVEDLFNFNGRCLATSAANTLQRNLQQNSKSVSLDQPTEGLRTAPVCGSGKKVEPGCNCKTVKGKDCIFPFTFRGQTYSRCTKAESENGRAWCATKVDKLGRVVRNFWEDCGNGCLDQNKFDSIVFQN